MSFAIKQGDTLPIMQITTSADLTGAAELVFCAKHVGGTEITGVPTLESSGPSGSVMNFVFVAGQTALVGWWHGEVTAEIGGEPITVPGLGAITYQVSERPC